MAEGDVISWNTVIGVFSVNALYEKVFVFFNNINSRSGTRPATLSVISVLSVCAGLEDEVMASQIHAYTVKVGLVTNCLFKACIAWLDLVPSLPASFY
ncbi:hypothetical protein NL676_017998 [Syzygium grande]|nr:hypothetical protein NL676_017998 [Syzygium grande]